MKKAYIKELQAKLLGTVTDNPDVLAEFATDMSAFRVEPTTAVYPANTADVRKIVQYAFEKTEAGKPVHLVARGLGAGESGGALGEDTVVVFPAHMNKLLRLEHDSVTVQPGISFRTLQQTLHTHARWLPAHPVSLDYATAGGVVAEDAVGLHSVKYGSVRASVKGLKVVLADGSLIQTHRLSGRELNRKKGLSTMEGEIYRKLDSLLLDHPELVRRSTLKTAHNGAGYALSQVRSKDGSFDASQIFIGSGGSLGLITEVTFKTASFNPRTTLVVGYFDSTYAALEAAAKLRTLGPSTLELADRQLLESVAASHPGYLDGLLAGDVPTTALLVQFDQPSQFSQRLASARAERIIGRHHGQVRTATDPVEQVALWKLRGASDVYMEPAGAKRAVPYLDGAIVPMAELGALLEKTTKLLKKYELTAAVWGHVGSGHLSFMPRLDLSKKKDADKLMNLSRDYAEAVASLGGTVSGTAADGLLRSLALPKLYDEELAELFASVKHIFDPHGMFAAQQKTAATAEFTRAHLRTDYTRARHHSYPTFS